VTPPPPVAPMVEPKRPLSARAEGVAESARPGEALATSRPEDHPLVQKAAQLFNAKITRIDRRPPQP